jgi:hypothetical protein
MFLHLVTFAEHNSMVGTQEGGGQCLSSWSPLMGETGKQIIMMQCAKYKHKDIGNKKVTCQRISDMKGDDWGK